MSALPAAAAAVNEQTLTEALAAASITAEPETTDENKPEEKKEAGELEEGEIQEEVDDGSPKTVFHNASRFNVKHPLYANWTLYFDSPQSKALPKTASLSTTGSAGHANSWLEDIRKVISFDSIEEFWGLYNNIVPPSQLPNKANYYLFKNGIIPAWEDPQNKNGGKWSIQLPRDKTRAAIDKMWLYTMLAAIGETFETPLDGSAPEQSDLVTGVVMSCRPAFYRIAIWTREGPADANTPETDAIMKRIMTIGRHFKTSVLGYNIDEQIGGGYAVGTTFELHSDSADKKKKATKITV